MPNYSNVDCITLAKDLVNYAHEAYEFIMDIPFTHSRVRMPAQEDHDLRIFSVEELVEYAKGLRADPKEKEGQQKLDALAFATINLEFFCRKEGIRTRLTDLS